MSSRPGKVLIVDDDAVVCSFVKKILEHEGHIVDTAESLVTGREALSADVDVAVIDIDLPDGEGFELVEILRKQYARPIAVVMITGNPKEEFIDKSVSQGIIEFLPKPFHAAELRDAVERAVAARARWEARIGFRPEGRVRRTRTPLGARRVPAEEIHALCRKLSLDHNLTEREEQTLEHILAGLQNADIARELRISANTVKYHVRNVLTKLRMESRTQLFRALLNRVD